MHFCSSFKGFEAVSQRKFDVTRKFEKFLKSLEFSLTGQLELEKFFLPLSIHLFICSVECKKHELADRSNLTFQLFQIMSKLSKVKRKYLKLVFVVTLKLQQVN